MSYFLKVLLVVAAILSVGYIVFDFFFSAKGDDTLQKYQITELDAQFDSNVFKFIAENSDLIVVKNE